MLTKISPVASSQINKFPCISPPTSRNEAMSRHRHQPVQPKRGCAIYLRTSSEEAQNPENSQRRQRHTIEHSFLSREPMPVLGEYIDNLSGRSSHNRPDYQRMLADARAGLFSHVVVENAERFGRNDTEALTAIDELHQLGVAVRFADYPDLDPIDPDDRIMVSLSFTLARRESMKLGQRVRGGLHAKLRTGGFVGRAPDGYINCEEKTETDKLQHGKYRRWIEQDPERAPIWRLAWDMLLTDQYTLAEICEALHQRGYRHRTGRPFITVNKSNVRQANINTISHIFHNWFYAGWVVSEKAQIAPKTVRGLWTPLITTEEFERGLQILAKRSVKTSRQGRHEYLLNNLVYMQHDNTAKVTRLTCSTSNPSRSGGGTSHYRILGSSHNFLCSSIESQVSHYIKCIQIDTELLPQIRAAYTREIFLKLGHQAPSEKDRIKATLKAIDEEEGRALRLFASGMVSEDNWRGLWIEWQDKRRMLKLAAESSMLQNHNLIANLDDALYTINKIGVLYDKLGFTNKKALLKQVVERIVVDTSGKLIRVDLQAPFAYLTDLNHQLLGVETAGNESASVSTSACSNKLQLSDPGKIRTYDQVLKRHLLYR